MSATFDWDQGLHNYTRDIISLVHNSKNLQRDFLKIVENVTLDIIKANAPSSTGNFGRSWRVTARGPTWVEIDTDMQDVFFALVNGTGPHIIRAGTESGSEVLAYTLGGRDFFSVTVRHPGSRKNDFMSPIVRALDDVVLELMKILVAKYYKVFKASDKRANLGSGNITKIVGLTGTRISKNRGRGKITLIRPRTGRRQFKRRLGRRRRSGHFLTKKDAQVR